MKLNEILDKDYNYSLSMLTEEQLNKLAFLMDERVDFIKYVSFGKLVFDYEWYISNKTVLNGKKTLCLKDVI